MEKAEPKPAYRAARPRRSRASTHITAALVSLCIVSIVTFLPLPYLGRSIASLFPRHACSRAQSIEQRVKHILRSTPLIDGHNDLPILIRTFHHNNIYSANFTFGNSLEGHVDLPRLHEGRVGGTFWSIFTSCPDTNNNFTDAVYAANVHDTLQQIDLVHRLVDAYPGDLELARTPCAVRTAHSRGKVASMMGVEGLHMVGNSASTLRLYHQLGVRYITLNHNCNNKYSDSALPANEPYWHGLSAEGEKLVVEMNRLGMMVDLAHTSKETMVHTLRVTRAPVIYSHSSAFAICPHPRNVPDDVLRLVKANNGIVMVNFYPRFIHCGPGREPKDATLSDVADHIEHIGRLIGWEHVGIGSDFDGILHDYLLLNGADERMGIDMVPEGLEDVSKFPALFAELLQRGITDEQAAGIAGGNVLRVWRGVEEVAREMAMEGVRPLEDEVEEIEF